MTGTTSVAVNWEEPLPCDTTAPALHLPGPITAEATSADGAVVTYAASATDTDPLNPPVRCLPASGATFPLGQTIVPCSAVDATGNVANGSFTVTVQDTIAPAVGSMTDLVVEETGALTTVSWTDPSATDAVGGTLPATCTPASGRGFRPAPRP